MLQKMRATKQGFLFLLCCNLIDISYISAKNTRSSSVSASFCKRTAPAPIALASTSNLKGQQRSRAPRTFDTFKCYLTFRSTLILYFGTKSNWWGTYSSREVVVSCHSEEVEGMRLDVSATIRACVRGDIPRVVSFKNVHMANAGFPLSVRSVNNIVHVMQGFETFVWANKPCGEGGPGGR